MDAALLIMLRNARGLSIEDLAERVGVHPDTIERWEAGDTRVPYPANRRRLANALGVPLGPLVVAVWGKQQGVPEAVIETNRRIVLQAAGLLPAALMAPRLPAVEFHQQAIGLVTRYATTPPIERLADARAHLNVLIAALRGPMLSGERRGLQIDAAETACLAAYSARSCGYHGEAAAFFTLARSLADESQVEWIRGCTRAAYSVLHAPIIGDNDPLAALDLLAAAKALVGEGGHAAKWVARLEAEMCAGLKREPEARTAIERAHAMPDYEDREGFFSGRGFFIGSAKKGEAQLAGCAGLDLILLGHAEEGLGHLDAALAAPVLNMCAPGELHAHAALGHAVAGHDPEPACAEAHHALDVADQTGHKVAVTRVLHARDTMPDPWAATPCVQQLDERLRLAL